MEQRKMTLFEKIIDITSGEETIRPYTAEEIAEVEAIQAQKTERDIKLAAKAAARQAVLDKLGLTADEITALLG
jgi:hypothetical protein